MRCTPLRIKSVLSLINAHQNAHNSVKYDEAVIKQQPHTILDMHLSSYKLLCYQERHSHYVNSPYRLPHILLTFDLEIQKSGSSEMLFSAFFYKVSIQKNKSHSTGRDSNPPVSAENLPFSAIVFGLPFSLNILMFFLQLSSSKVR